jgi:hypothetical protein
MDGQLVSVIRLYQGGTRRISDARTLENEDDCALLITLIGLTALRNPDMRENIRKIREEAGRMNIAARLRSKDTYDASVQQTK